MTPMRTALAHELWNHSVEGGTFVAETLLARAQRPEVLGCLRNYVRLQLHHDPACRYAGTLYVEENSATIGWRAERRSVRGVVGLVHCGRSTFERVQAIPVV